MEDNPLIARLRHGCCLNEQDIIQLRNLCGDIRSIGRSINIMHDGGQSDHLHLIMSGWAARYKLLSNGARQITGLLLPGDLCDLRCVMMGRMDGGIMALSSVRVAYLSPQATKQLTYASAQIDQAMTWCSLIEEATLRAWIVNMGRRRALERTAHLLSELTERLAMIVSHDTDSHILPLTQEDMADTLGLTPVHINRVLQDLRGQGMISLRRGGIHVLDLAGLQQLAGFDGAYLRPQMVRLAEPIAA